MPCVVLALRGMVAAQEFPDPSEVRRLASDAGLGSLRKVRAPAPTNLGDFLLSGSNAKKAAIQLGKALYWDMQVGSDGQACASCHFHAGADDRTKNQLNPGLRNTNPALASAFDTTASGGGGPNYQLTADDFPFHQLDDAQDRTSSVLHDSDDVASSQGVFDASFGSIVRGKATDQGQPEADPVFNVNAVNVRRVEPRNTPSVINAVFNAMNFWDGRAHDLFNGVSSLGPLDATATILVDSRGTLVRQAIRIDHASLASQAVEPPRSNFEMAFANRPFAALGRKLTALRPLGQQLVHPQDSVLGSLSRAALDHGRVVGKTGLTVSYEDLVKRSFQKKYWSSGKKVDGYTQIENNWSLFFGLALQLYESTLVSDKSPFDQFMEGDDEALTDVQRVGLLVFINRGPGISDDPLFDEVNVGRGNCVTCHGGAAFTNATAAPSRGPIAVRGSVDLVAGSLVVGAETAFADEGFSNIGVRPTAEDVGRGGMEVGLPLSFIRQRLLALPFAPALAACGAPGEGACPQVNRTAVDGAFKTPGLRNVELTGPYFHNGGQATLREVMLFYERQGDFSNENVVDLDPNLANVGFVEDDELPLVHFLVSLTDERVRDEDGPFDHPQLFLPNGHAGDQTLLACVNGLQACDDLLEIPPVGTKGRKGAGLTPLETFLGLDPMN